MITRHLVLTHYDDESDAAVDVFCFSAPEVENLDRRAQFEAAFAEAYHAADDDKTSAEFDHELAQRGINVEMESGFTVHDWDNYNGRFDKEG